jgi:hypothetical protein
MAFDRTAALSILRKAFPDYGIDDRSKFEVWLVSRVNDRRVTSRDFEVGQIVTLYPWASPVETAADPVFAARNECARVLRAEDRDAGDEERGEHKPYVALSVLRVAHDPTGLPTLSYSHAGSGMPIVSLIPAEDVAFANRHSISRPVRVRDEFADIASH